MSQSETFNPRHYLKDNEQVSSNRLNLTLPDDELNAPNELRVARDSMNTLNSVTNSQKQKKKSGFFAKIMKSIF